MPVKKCLFMVFVMLFSLLSTGCADAPGPSNGTVPLPEPDGPGDEYPDDDSVPPDDQALLHIVYEKAGELMLVVDDNAPQTLISGADDGYPLISPDGSRVLFQRRLPAGPSGLPRFELWVVNIDGSEARPIVALEDLPGRIGETMESPEPVLLDRLPWQVTWLENSMEVAFNTVLEAGYGILTHDDLWLVDVEIGEVSQLLPDGLGGSFAFSPDGDAVLVANAESVSIMNADGGNRRLLISFPFVNTASEYAFIPQPVWTPDSSYGLVAISSPDPFGFEEEPYLTIWRLPKTGDAERLLEVFGFNLAGAMSGNLFSPDGGHFAYTEGTCPDGNAHFATLDGSVIATFNCANNILGWSSDGRLFIFMGDGELFLTGIERPMQNLDLPFEIFTGSAALKWVGPTTYVGLDLPYSEEFTTLWVSDIDGESRIIARDVNSFDARFIN